MCTKGRFGIMLNMDFLFSYSPRTALSAEGRWVGRGSCVREEVESSQTNIPKKKYVHICWRKIIASATKNHSAHEIYICFFFRWIASRGKKESSRTKKSSSSWWKDVYSSIDKKSPRDYWLFFSCSPFTFTEHFFFSLPFLIRLPAST